MVLLMFNILSKCSLNKKKIYFIIIYFLLNKNKNKKKTKQIKYIYIYIYI